MRYLPPIQRRTPFGGSPGQLLFVLVLVALALFIFTGTGNPQALLRGARDLAFLFPALIISLSFHELAHALVANSLGDDTARRQGRLTLDPRAHLDPLGTFMLVITVILGFGIGWARPVPVNPWRLRIGPRAGMAVVALAGPISNLMIAYVSIQLGKLLISSNLPEDVIQLLTTLAFLNVALAVFNMIPLPPLDGYRVLVGVLPGPVANTIASLEPYGPMILMMFVFMGGGILSGIIRAVGVPLLRAMAA